MSLLSEYEQRTAWKYEPIQGFFHTAEGLARKVNPTGDYVPFPGTTAVFRPDKTCLGVIRLMQQVLSQRLSGTGMLASPLPASTIHLTLHDLVCPEKCVSDPGDEAGYQAELTESLRRAAGIVEKIHRDYAGRRISMAADRIVQMVSKSLVLLLKPLTEADCQLLLEMYDRFEEIVRLPYPLTPHITLAYFKPGTLDGGILQDALDFAQIRPGQAPVFEFHPEGLTAQLFRDMQSYLDVPRRICFCCDGGLNRSVLAANILNHLAKERKLPVAGEARSAYRSTQGWQVPGQVWTTLESHGIQPDKSYSAAQYLEDGEAAHFSEFAPISGGAADRIAWLGLPEERTANASRFFFGVRDPEYGEVTHEQAFADLRGRTEKYLDAFESEYKQYIKG